MATSALPFRFKAGGGGQPAEGHHHRSSTKVAHKAFKSRHASKGSIKALLKGKIESGHRQTRHQQVMSKIGRRNQARQKQRLKRHQHAQADTIFIGRDAAPKRVVVVPLCAEVDAPAAVTSLNASLDIEVADAAPATSSIVNVDVERFKRKLQYVVVRRQLASILDGCRVADFVLFVLSAAGEIDADAERLLRAIEGQGVTNVVAVIQGLDGVQPSKRRPQVVTSLKSQMGNFFPDLDRPMSLDSRQECTNVVRLLCNNSPRGVRWREDRSWMLVEDIRWPTLETKPNVEKHRADQLTEAVLTGTIRGRGLNANRLVVLADWGTYQIDKITETVAMAQKKARNGESMELDSSTEPLAQPTDDQDELAELAPPEARVSETDNDAPSIAESNRKGVLLDDHHNFSEDEEDDLPRPKRLPKGTSSYQAAWYLDDDTDSSAESLELDEEGDLATDASEAQADASAKDGRSVAYTEVDDARSAVSATEMFLDPSPEDEKEQLAAFRARHRDEARDDLEFPDEIELSPETVARERLARYRGLKSLRTSPWDTTEDKAHEPEDWQRLLQIRNCRATSHRAIRETLVGGVPAGKRVHVHLRNVPLSLAKQDIHLAPLGLYSLLRHEQKHTIVNMSITLDAALSEPLKSKEELIVQCGPRRFVINPLFSQLGQTQNNVHKYERFLHPGRTAAATFIGPVTWGPVPTLFFRRRRRQGRAVDGGEGSSDRMETDADGSVSAAQADNNDADSGLELIGHGTCLPPDLERVIAKRVILTGHPYKIHRNVVTVRYMFFSAADVAWFKALPLWTKRGRSGFIKESLGTHGYFKATFDRRINAQDTVCVSLYKRVFPRPAAPYNPSSSSSS